MRIILALLAILATTSAALAQFPPPGVYRCLGADGTPFGTLSLFAAGDYQFSVAGKPDDPGNGKGQLTSAGTSVSLQSGPLAALHWKGSFTTDAHKQHTSFAFTDDKDSKISCGK